MKKNPLGQWEHNKRRDTTPAPYVKGERQLKGTRRRKEKTVEDPGLSLFFFFKRVTPPHSYYILPSSLLEGKQRQRGWASPPPKGLPRGRGTLRRYIPTESAQKVTYCWQKRKKRTGFFSFFFKYYHIAVGRTLKKNILGGYHHHRPGVQQKRGLAQEEEEEPAGFLRGRQHAASPQ